MRSKSVEELLEDMRSTGFQGRNLGESVQIWSEMLNQKGLTVFMGLSGAMVPAGMRRIIAFLIERRMIDCLVSTGANLFHDLHEALGGSHYLGHEGVDGSSLFECRVDRIHDVFASEDEFRALDRKIADFAAGLDPDRPYSSRELIYLLGKVAVESGGAEDSILVSAFKANLPVYAPALSDSSIGLGLAMARREGNSVLVDHIKDVDEITRIVEASSQTGVVYVGGGVPKNFIQQTEVLASLAGGRDMGHDYAIQYTTDSPQWGGLSGCTFEEAVSWGKISVGARKVQVFADATIALPLVSQALYEKAKKTNKPRKHPTFDVSDADLEIKI